MMEPYDTIFKDILRLLFGFEMRDWSWCQRLPKIIAEPIWDASNHEQLILEGLEFDNVSHLVNLKSDFTYSTVMTASGQLQTYVGMISPNSTSGLISWIDEKSWKPTERELNDSIQRQITKEDPYQRVNAASNPNKSTPYQSPTACKEPLRLGMVDILFRKWDQAARPKNATKIFSASFLSALDLLKKFKDKNASGRDEAIGMMAWGLRFLHQMDQRGNWFFVTESGFIGFGPADLEEGDNVVLLYDSQFPAALRRMPNEHWRFVGFLYVRGIMNEESFIFFRAWS